jgi:hypothetical protein
LGHYPHLDSFLPLLYLSFSLFDPGDQILLKNSKCSELLQIERERRPRRHEPNATRLGSNRRRMREILQFVQNNKHAKKCVDCIVRTVRTDADVVDRITCGRCVGNHVDESAYDTWLVFGEWDGNTWPNQWPPRVT